MFYTPEGLTNNSPRSPMTPTPVNKPSDRKYLCLFTNILDVKKKTAICWVGVGKSKCKATKSGTIPWALKPKRKVNPKINNQINKSLYNWIINHPQVVQSPIFNDCLKMRIYGHTVLQIVPKLLLEVSVWEINNSLVSDPVDGGLKAKRDAENNIVISDSILHSLLPLKLKKYHQNTRYINKKQKNQSLFRREYIFLKPIYRELYWAIKMYFAFLKKPIIQ